MYFQREFQLSRAKTKELPLSATSWQFWAKIGTFLATFLKSNPVGFQEIQKCTSNVNFSSLARKLRNCHFVAVFSQKLERGQIHAALYGYF